MMSGRLEKVQAQKPGKTLIFELYKRSGASIESMSQRRLSP